MGTKYLPRRLGQHLADAKELTAPRTWNSNSVGVSHGKTDIWSMILPWVYNLYTCDNATWKVYKFPHWMPHNKAICSLYYTICTNCIQLWKGLCTLRVHSITRIKMRVHAVFLNWRFGVRLKMGKSIRGGDTQPLRGLRGRHSRRRWLSRMKVTFCEAESSYWLSEQSGFWQLYGIVETALWSPLPQRLWNNMVRVRSVYSVTKYEFGVSLSLVHDIGKMTHWFFWLYKKHI